MSSFGFGGGGFGSNSNNNQQQQNTGFGGFGSNNNTGTGFGQQPQNAGFGGANNNTGGGLFGSGGTGFGAANSTPFGPPKPAFGANNTSGGGLFGSTPSTTGGTGFGGFGANTTSAPNNSSPFGGTASTGGTLFGGASKPGFGVTSTGGSLFGGAGTGNTFGQSTGQTSSAFGAPPSTALGANVAESQGTHNTPFQPYTEKDTPGGTTTNHFQSISFMQPYQKYSPEELRMADYNQGYRFGNSNGQAGAFGQNSGFGGFGGQPTQNTNNTFGGTGGGLFGNQPTTSSNPFGSTTQTAGGFGQGGTVVPFGTTQQSPAGGLFGSTTAATSSQTAGGLFGTSGQTGFGNQQSTGFGNNAGGGLFGANPQGQKPSFPFGPSSTTNTSNAGTGFGNTSSFGTGTATTGTGGIFGNSNNAGPGLFGAQPQQQNQTGNTFGGAAQTSTNFGAFGNNNQQGPGGLFGATNTTSANGGGLFGNPQNSQPNQTGSNLFGGANNNNQTTGGGLFGAKPATTGTGGLFGNNANNTNSSTGGIFSSSLGNNTNQTQQNQGGSLFGNNNQQQQKPNPFGGTTGGLFGNANNGTSLFGNPGMNNNQNNQGGGLFSNSNNNGNNNSSLFGGLQQNPLQPPQTMTASIFDSNPYGSSSIFNGLPPPPQVSPGPIATPIMAGQHKPTRLAPLPYHKMNLSMASRLVTPQKRGFGFSYGTYGTPNSASSTPGGLSGGLMGSRSLGKSFSTSNLRRNFENDGESILSPGAFSAGSTRYAGTGSLKRLTIDRSLRTDFFGSHAIASLPSPDKNDPSRQPSILKKKVSFDTNTVGGNGREAEMNGSKNGDIGASANGTAPSAQEQGFFDSSSLSSPRRDVPRPIPATPQVDMEQVNGQELAIVHEDGSPETSNDTLEKPPRNQDQSDPQPGNYYMSPTREELRKMPRERLKQFSGFIIGREGCGHVAFDQPVDLTTVDLDNIFDNIAVITLRSLTIYPQTNKKPPVGKGFNVPSTVTLENSWPRMRDRKTPSYEKSGPKFVKHVDRLRRVIGTEFVKYDKDSGEWVFKVPHFTTYALDYDDDASEGDTFQNSVLSEAPSTPTPKPRYTPRPTNSAQESSVLSGEPSELDWAPDDTFDFKKKKLLPGAFDNEPPFEDDQEMEEVDHTEESFLDERSAHSPSDSGVEEPSELREDHNQQEDRSVIIQDDAMDMVGSFPRPSDLSEEEFGARDSTTQSRSNLKMNQTAFGTPRVSVVNMANDWAEQLQRTMSPRKQDRQVLRQSQARLLNKTESEEEDTPTAHAPKRDRAGFATSIDLMNSLFGKEELRKSSRDVQQTRKGQGFEWPYAKKSKANYDTNEMTENDQAFHETFKPRWGPSSTLLHSLPTSTGVFRNPSTKDACIVTQKKAVIVSEGRDIQFSNFVRSRNITPENFAKQRSQSDVTLEHGIPHAKPRSLPFSKHSSDAKSNRQEQIIWELASILFDECKDDSASRIPMSQQTHFEHRIRKDGLSSFWSRICQDQALAAVAAATTAEERAIAYLSTHKIREACDALVDGKDFRLAILIAQIGGDPKMHEDMTAQINTWRGLRNLSEMTDSIRALYELLAGNVCLCQGYKGAAEDIAKTFVISERFQLDWKRAFGLRLWYAIQSEEPLEAAVKKYARDLANQESKRPTPWFIENGTALSWSDEHPGDREDPLWGMLKLYAESKEGSISTRLADVVMPLNVSGHPIDNLLSYEMYLALSPRFPAHVDLERADQLVWDFTTQLEAAGEWQWALFAVLHLSNSQQRQRALQTLLASHAGAIDQSDPNTLQLLTNAFGIPEDWIWTAKALYARSVENDHVKEVEYLLRAKDWTEAHRTLCRIVAPQLVIEQDYGTLLGLLENFEGKDKVSDWTLGGQVYGDYVRLVRGLLGREKHVVVKRLLTTLPTMMQKRPGKIDFAETVAVQEMSAVVGNAVLADKDKTLDSGRVLQLPLSEDIHLKHTVDLSLCYYKALMTQGK